MKTEQKLQTYIISLGLFLLPLIALPFFPNFTETPKIILLAAIVLLLLLIKAASLLFGKESKFLFSNFDLAVFGLSASYLVAAAVASPNKMEAFFLPGVATVMISLGFIYFFINQLGEEKKSLISVFFLSGVALAIVSVLAYLRILGQLPFIPRAFASPEFNPSGSILSASLFLISLAPIGVGLVLESLGLAKKIFWALSLLILIIGIGTTTFQILPNINLVDFRTSWAVAADAIKESPIVGIGPGNYLSAFNLYRPLSYNATDLWAIKFTTARNFYLTLITEAGLLAAFFVVLITLGIIKQITPAKENLSVHASLITTLILFSLFPISFVNISQLFVLLALVSKTTEKVLNFDKAKLGFVSFVILGLVFLGAYWGVKVVLAEAKFKKALDAAAQGQGRETYDFLGEAISLNPYVDRYRATAAQVNLALAQSLAQNLPAQAGKALSEEDRKTVGQLIQSAISHGKATVSLNPQRSQNWEILAQIYRAVMSFAQGADNFAIQSYNQAIALDPINPNLRIALGGVYYSLGRYDEAIDSYKLATLAKPDFANAHYNLAIAYREKGEIQKAINEIKIVLSQVAQDSPDYKLAKNELGALEKRRPPSETGEGESLTPPEETEPAITPAIPLPEDATPPASE